MEERVLTYETQADIHQGDCLSRDEKFKTIS